jgi:hypothetical protein
LITITMNGTPATGQTEDRLPPVPHGKDLAASDRPSVLGEIQHRKRRRRHKQPPAWLLMLSRQWQRLSNGVPRSLPTFLSNRRPEFVTAAISLLAHIVMGLLLAAWILPSETSEHIFAILSLRDTSDPPEIQWDTERVLDPELLMELNTDSTMQQISTQLQDGFANEAVDVPLADTFQMPFDELDAVRDVPTLKGELGQRSAVGRMETVRKYGGTVDSERAVMLGLLWLQSIQQEDGSWNFAEIGDAPDPGRFASTETGATALAMLCFLGAGHTHLSEGRFQDSMQHAMEWMMNSAVVGSFGADLRGTFDGNCGMYVQGLATIVVCEAAAMEPDDRALRRLAIEAVAFIERSQDPFGGGWRYQPRQPGDTSVTGWQLMALQSAKAGRIRVDDRSFRDARNFLTTVESGGGAYYGYVRPEVDRHPMTAVGLLCRMYLGWKRSHNGLRRGVERLSEVGPSRDDMYYNYYATQVMHHWGGEEWNRWNERMREQLINTQVREGAAAGSWNVTDPHGDAGGRIYQTALSILTLEVYYRHLPLYRKLEHLPNAAASAGDGDD